MSRDDYRQRVDDYQRYQDYKYDQRILQQELSTRSTQVHEALRRRDYDCASWALRIPGHLATSSGVESCIDEPENQSLINQISALVRDINESLYISGNLQSHWIKGLGLFADIDSNQALNRIIDFKIAFSAWKLNNRPEPSIWDIGDSKIWLFDSEVLLIECKIDRIRWYLESEVRNN